MKRRLPDSKPRPRLASGHFYEIDLFAETLRGSKKGKEGKIAGVFVTEVDCVDEEIYFNTKSAKQNTKGANILWA